MYFSTHFAVKAVLAAALATQATALPTTQPPSAVLTIRNSVGQPGFNVEPTPADVQKRSVNIEARGHDMRAGPEGGKARQEARKRRKPKAEYGICRVGAKGPCGGNVNLKRDVDEAAALEARGYDMRAGPMGGKARQEARKKNKPKADGGICVAGVESPCNGNVKRDVDEAATLQAREPRKPRLGAYNMEAGPRGGKALQEEARRKNREPKGRSVSIEARGYNMRAGPLGGKARQEARKRRKPTADGGICAVGAGGPCNGNVKRDVDEAAALEAREPPQAQSQAEP